MPFGVTHFAWQLRPRMGVKSFPQNGFGGRSGYWKTQKLKKNNKNIHNGDCILAKKKTILPPKNKKKKKKIMCYWRS